MCGIAGIVDFNAGSIQQQALEAMCAVIAHRGPDGQGIYINENRNVGLAHRRLSIIDLSAAASQPMHYLHQRYTLVFNGEIYNYIELKDKLVRKGYTFLTHSDTEVLLALFDDKREQCLNELDGMFAFAIWDEKEQQFFCARDRFGEKPFFFLRKNQRLVFASEIKSLLQVDRTVKLSNSKINSYLKDGTLPYHEETFFEGIEALLPAHYLLMNAQGVEIKKYWDIDLENRTQYSSEEDYALHFEELFKESVARRLRSDVPFGSSLSGGLDSSFIVSYINSIYKKPFDTFSARFDDPLKDEGKWIDEVIKKTSVRNHTVYPNPAGFTNELDKLLWHHEFPPASSSIYAQWCVMKLVAQHKIKVLLDGQGADEYLAGYDNLKYYIIWELYRQGNWSRFMHEKKLLRQHFGSHVSAGVYFLFDPLLSIIGIKRSVFKNGYTTKERLKYAVQNELVELLRYADRNSMAYSVEVRLPFLYHRLIEYVFSVPITQIYKEGKTKYILREAGKKVVPQAILSRTDKIGFAPPQQQWMQEPGMVKMENEAIKFLSARKITPAANGYRNIVMARFISVFDPLTAS